jgi:oligopeptide transport system substrate-binding protein
MNFLKKIVLTIVALSIVASFSLTLIGCPPAPPVEEVEETTPEETTVAPPEVEEPITLVFNAGTEPPTGDPSLATDTTSVQLLEDTFLGLTSYLEGGEIEPELAKDWTLSEDGLEWTFNMRDDIYWVKYNCQTDEVEQVLDEDGNPIKVTAHDIVYGVRRTINPETASEYAYVLYVIKNAEAVNTTEEEITPELLETIGVEAVDDYTVKFTLEHQAPYFPGIAGMWVCRPMPQANIEEYGEKWVEPCFKWQNGYYVQTEWAHGDHYTLVKNPFHPEAEDVQIEKIVAYCIEETSTEFAMYEANELDTSHIPLPEIDRVKEDPVLSKELVIQPTSCTYYYGFTNNKPPFDNHLVRKAFSAAIDRQTLIDTVIKGEQIPANSLAPAMIFGNVAGDPDVGIMYDPDQARAWLEEAGYPNGEGFPEVTLMHNVEEGHARIAQAIQAMWKEELGVTVKIETQEWKVYLKTVEKDTPLEDMPHIFRMGWCADYYDQNNWVHEVFNCESGANRLRRGCLDPTCTKIEKLKFDELTEQASIETDPEKRKELYKQAEIELNNVETAFAPIYFYTTVNVAKPWLTRTYISEGEEQHQDWRIDWEAKKAAIGG